jgi:TonB family protein
MARPLIAFLLMICSVPPAIGQVTTEHVRVSDAVIQGLLIKKVNPLYPPLARQARIQGTVVLNVTISKTGDVKSVQLISGHPLLAPAAIEAVKQWKYQPYVLNGEAVEVETSVRVNFALAGEPVGATPGSPPDSVDSNCDLSPGERDASSTPLVREKVDPIYPPSAIQARIQGTVVLGVHVNASCDVESARLISGHPMLVQPTIDAVRQWKFNPRLVNGALAPFETLVRVNYRLSGSDDTVGSVTEAVEEGLPGPAQPGTPQRVRVSSGVAQAFLRSKVNPDYPPDARDQRIQGVVLMKINIDKEGNVYAVQLISGHPLLAPSAMEAVRQWKYRPYLLNGNPVEVETQVLVNFTLAP